MPFLLNGREEVIEYDDQAPVESYVTGSPHSLCNARIVTYESASLCYLAKVAYVFIFPTEADFYSHMD